MNFLKTTLPLILLFSLTNSYAQFTVDAQLRPRFEYRHGYKTLFPDNVDPAAFVSQRTRLNFGYKTEKLNFYLSPQDIRVWGDVPQLNTVDENGFSLHQAWGELLFTPQLYLKIGRQELVYDDQRFLGNVDWAQQGRSHDAVILKYEPSFMRLHFGAAYNQDKEALTGNVLTTNTYKNLQYVWLHKDWEKLNASFLFLNNGLQYIDEIDESKNETRYSQTLGLHLKRNVNKFSVISNLYYQLGKDVSDNELRAYLLSLEAKYAATENLIVGLGGELQSGNDYGLPSNGKNEAFNPLYGTNHKFNGFMDYFYVGNHLNNVGLIDANVNIKYSFNKKANVQVAFHQFFAAAEIVNETSKDLGFELDLVSSFKMTEFTGIQAGYSQFFASKGTQTVKNNFDGNSNNWAWIIVTIDPVLFSWQKQNTVTIN